MRKGGQIDEVERGRNRNNSRICVRVEDMFVVIKRRCGFNKVRYQGLGKNAPLFRGAGTGEPNLGRARLTGYLRPQGGPGLSQTALERSIR